MAHIFIEHTDDRTVVYAEGFRDRYESATAAFKALEQYGLPDNTRYSAAYWTRNATLEPNVYIPLNCYSLLVEHIA